MRRKIHDQQFAAARQHAHLAHGARRIGRKCSTWWIVPNPGAHPFGGHRHRQSAPPLWPLDHRSEARATQASGAMCQNPPRAAHAPRKLNHPALAHTDIHHQSNGLTPAALKMALSISRFR